MKPIIVTTKFKGVFYGYLSDDQDENAEILVLTKCRNAIYWAGKGGFLGLAATGPEENSRIGAVAPLSVRLHGVTSLSECSSEAAKKWDGWK